MKTKVHFAQRASSLLYFYLMQLPSDKNEWILPANICPIVAATFLKANKKIIFLDIDLKTLSFEMFELKKTLLENHQIQGVLWVRAYGYTIDNLDETFHDLKNIAPKIKIIDDACLMEPDFNPVLKEADLKIFSTGYSKFVDVGFGGWAVSREEMNFANYNPDFSEEDYNGIVKLFESCLKGKTPFILPENSWLDLRYPQYQTSDYLNEIRQKSQESREHKAQLNAIFMNYLGRWAFPLTHHQWRFNLLIENRDQVLSKIFESGHFASKNYPSLVNIFSSGKDENARFFEARILNLFNDFRYTKERAEELALIIQKELER